MKKFILKQWYPSLPNGIEVGHIIEFDRKANLPNGDEAKLYLLRRKPTTFIMERELHPDFWELIEGEKPKPLFITEDGFKFFSETNREFYIVVNFIKYRSTISDFEDQKKLSHKVFYRESNADEYIAWYKKEFSINDLLLADVGITISQLDKLQELAKERVRNEKEKKVS